MEKGKFPNGVGGQIRTIHSEGFLLSKTYIRYRGKSTTRTSRIRFQSNAEYFRFISQVCLIFRLITLLVREINDRNYDKDSHETKYHEKPIPSIIRKIIRNFNYSFGIPKDSSSY